jgi:hypothetical protein
MASSIERKSPGVISAFVGAVLSLVLGAILAAVHLAAQPVEVLKTAPKEDEEAGKLYCVLGTPGSPSGRAWRTKHDALTENTRGEVVLTEAELNAWAENTFEPAKLEDDVKGRTLMILAGAPNFRFVGTELQIALVNTFNFFGSEYPLVLQARGGFEKADSGWRFVADEARLGALPLHKVPALFPLLADRFGAAQPPPVVEKVLREAREITVRDDTLVIALK